LKMHAAGYLPHSDGSLYGRGSVGGCWSSSQYINTYSWGLGFNSDTCWVSSNYGKAFGFTARCLKD
jgi:hypothetical protein